MLNLFVGLDIYTGLLLLLALAFVLFYEAINGFHDTANAVATVIYTRAMQPQLAVVMAAFFNFFGVLLGGLSVAYAIVHMLPTDLLLNMGSTHGLAMVFSMLLAAIIWNLGTWFFGLPASSSHTLIGAIIGIGLTNALLNGSSVMDALNLREVTKIFSSLIVSPIVCLLYTNPHPGICDVCQSALGGLFPSGSFLPPRQRFFELFPHPLIFSYISFSSGLLWYFLIVIHGLTSSLDMPVSVIRVVHDALCHWPLLSLSMQVFLL
ncbi:hypothetical protein G921_03302 [Escherichia coli UMEA 3155-1]|nr:hypothetical protein G921_03302 [Escherichia coli UMEA 3155-1]